MPIIWCEVLPSLLPAQSQALPGLLDLLSSHKIQLDLSAHHCLPSLLPPMPFSQLGPIENQIKQQHSSPPHNPRREELRACHASRDSKLQIVALAKHPPYQFLLLDVQRADILCVL